MSTAERTYGGFHHPQGFGILGLGPIGSLIAGAGAFGTVLLIPWAGAAVAIVFGLVIAVGLAGAVARGKDRKSFFDKLTARFGFRRTVKTGSNLYIPGSLTYMGGHRLPGVLANSELAEWRDKNDDPFTLLRYPADRTLVVPLMAEPDGSSLLGDEDLAEQVDEFGLFLSSLGFEPDLIQAAFTVESSKDPGSALNRELADHAAPEASSLAQEWATEVRATYPQGGSTIRSYGSLSYKAPKAEVDMAGKKIKGLPASEIVGRSVASRLPGLLAKLNNTGSGIVHAMTPEELIETTRCAYNPEDRKMYDELASLGQDPPVQLWDSVGPSAGQAHAKYYEHGGAASITWEGTGFITPQVAARALAPLLAPIDTEDKVAVKRISFLYHPIDPAKSAIIAETNHSAAVNARINKKKKTAASKRKVDEADRIRKREAAGHALLDFSILVTATVLDVKDLPAARTFIERLGPTSRLHLHPMDKVQDSAFAQGQAQLGLVTQQHLAIPTAFTKGL